MTASAIFVSILPSILRIRPILATKYSSLGKTLAKSYEIPRKGNVLGKEASDANP